MPANRMQRFQTTVPRFSIAAPMAAAGGAHAIKPAGVPQGFVVCPPGMVTANAWQQEVYRLAYERAKAAAEVPRHYRRLFSVWN